MIKIKNILIVAIASILIYACSASNPFIDDFDHAGQALKDNDTLVKYLTNHYYDTVIDSIKPITTGKTALIDDVNLKTQNVNFDDIDYCKNCDFLFDDPEVLVWSNDPSAKVNHMRGTEKNFILTNYSKNS